MKKTILSLLAMSLSFSASASDAYSLEDLKALQASQSWQELLAHANDIRPSQRDTQWKALVEQAALGSFTQFIQAGNSDKAIYLGQEVLQVYPFLSQSDAFTQTFSEQLVKAAQPCVRYSAESCVENYGNLLATLSPQAELSFAEGVKVYQNVSKSLSVPFFASAVKQSSQYCADEKVANALLYTLERPKNANFALAKEVATTVCVGTALANFENYVIESKSVRAALCPTYVSKGYVKGIIKQVCES
ncbi:hypothetical protein ACVQAZ_003578 [Vibrio vulnificus]